MNIFIIITEVYVGEKSAGAVDVDGNVLLDVKIKAHTSI